MKQKYIGDWQIESMEMWEPDYISLSGPGRIIVSKNGTGSLRFGSVEAEIDCRVELCGETERLEFTFEGTSEGDAVSGRGWAVAEEKIMKGKLYFHLGDESAFTLAKP